MSTLDTINTITHGTPEGVRQGCRTAALCPHPVTCREVAKRYAGDYTFRRRMDEGMTAVEIVSLEAEEQLPVKATRAREVVIKSGTSRKARPARKFDRDELRRLHAEGLNDGRIAEALGVARNTINKVRQELGLPRAVDPATGKLPLPAPAVRASRRGEIAQLNGEGLRDAEIAERLSMHPVYVSRVRRDMGLPTHGGTQ